MSNNHDERAMLVLEKAVERAKDQLVKKKFFRPFLMILNNEGIIEIVENEVLDSIKSYDLLGNMLKERILKEGVDVLVLAVDTLVPEKLSQDVSSSIRLHLEEKSQVDKIVSARFLYVPYELCKIGEGEVFVRLHAPIPLGFPAEYIVK